MTSLGHPCKFQLFSCLGSVTARHSSSGRQPNFAALNRGRHLYSAGRPSRWALAHISSSFFFSSPILNGCTLDVYYTSTHSVALVRIYNAGLTCAACGSLKNTGRNNLPSVHHRTTLSGYIFATKVCIRNRKKKLVKQHYISSTCPHNMVSFGPLTAEISFQVWGTPANFNGFHVLASLPQRRRSLKVNQTWHDVWPFPGLIHCIHFRGLLPPNGILPDAKFTLHSSLAFFYIGSITARHASSGRQPNCGVVSSRDRAAILFDTGWSNYLVFIIFMAG